MIMKSLQRIWNLSMDTAFWLFMKYSLKMICIKEQSSFCIHFDSVFDFRRLRFRIASPDFGIKMVALNAIKIQTRVFDNSAAHIQFLWRRDLKVPLERGSPPD
ncbi:uncharacterized protein LOC120781353 isoform X2 [Bactrocera tryoni]|uniref:uncharacterized protein LOC120781353 isoform X2 n=1 Tax=Bactrocera tryoni TaxID=59916 RepID=UPI001A9641D1|nr:uncharacterized protein LOC120781353 isoform X2 [Bactrocera tryoni]